MLSEPSEASVRGAALLALEAAGKIESIAGLPVHMEQTFEPNMSRHVLYQEGLKRQQRIYARVIESP
jgi:gluconokinase